MWKDLHDGVDVHHDRGVARHVVLLHQLLLLCQPLDRNDYLFLLSSRGQGGCSPMRMTDADRKFYERFKEPIEPTIARPFSGDLSSLRWTGRRFVEVRK